MKTTIKLRGQDQPIILDNVQVAQQRVPMYVVTQGDIRHRFHFDTIEKIIEEGVMSDPADLVSTDEVDTQEPQTGDTAKAKARFSKRASGEPSKAIDNDIARLAGAFADTDMPEVYDKQDITKRVEEKLGVKSAMSHRIVRRLEEAGKIRRYKNAKEGWGVVDPVLCPSLKEYYEMEQEDKDNPRVTLEQWVEQLIKEDYV
jgi:hypothetical protein